MSKMTSAQVAEILWQQNAWRRDDSEEAPLEQVNPTQPGNRLQAAGLGNR
ncbi:hypothetical protein [Rhodanobacter sp. B04]|nr:hypothetical protein [Rhodanobacter sp. B04]